MTRRVWIDGPALHIAKDAPEKDRVPHENKKPGETAKHAYRKTAKRYPAVVENIVRDHIETVDRRLVHLYRVHQFNVRQHTLADNTLRKRRIEPRNVVARQKGRPEEKERDPEHDVGKEPAGRFPKDAPQFAYIRAPAAVQTVVRPPDKIVEAANRIGRQLIRLRERKVAADGAIERREPRYLLRLFTARPSGGARHGVERVPVGLTRVDQFGDGHELGP